MICSRAHTGKWLSPRSDLACLTSHPDQPASCPECAARLLCSDGTPGKGIWKRLNRVVKHLEPCPEKGAWEESMAW